MRPFVRCESILQKTLYNQIDRCCMHEQGDTHVPQIILRAICKRFSALMRALARIHNIFCSDPLLLRSALNHAIQKPLTTCQQLHPSTNQFHCRSLIEITKFVKLLGQDLGQLTGWMGVFRGRSEKLRLESDGGTPKDSTLSMGKSQDVIRKPKKVSFFTILTL